MCAFIHPSPSSCHSLSIFYPYLLLCSSDNKRHLKLNISIGTAWQWRKTRSETYCYWNFTCGWEQLCPVPQKYIKNKFVQDKRYRPNLTYILIGTYLFTYLLTHLLAYLLTHLHNYLLAYLFIYLLTYLHIYLLTYLLAYLLTYLPTFSLTYLLTYLLTYRLTYLLIYLLT